MFRSLLIAAGCLCAAFVLPVAHAIQANGLTPGLPAFATTINPLPPVVATRLVPGATENDRGLAYWRSWSQQRSSGTRCGIERWAYKTLADPQGAAVAIKRPDPATVRWLDSIPAPADPDRLRHRDAPIETHVWIVAAALEGYAHEADGDYHLVLRGLTSNATMIAEIPSPHCVHRYGALYARERAFIRGYGSVLPRHRFRWLANPPHLFVVGVGFFDRIHGQDGVAPNGVELHPVLYLKPDPS